MLPPATHEEKWLAARVPCHRRWQKVCYALTVFKWNFEKTSIPLRMEMRDVKWKVLFSSKKLPQKACFLAKGCSKGLLSRSATCFPMGDAKTFYFPVLATRRWQWRARCARYFFCPSKTKAHHQARWSGSRRVHTHPASLMNLARHRFTRPARSLILPDYSPAMLLCLPHSFDVLYLTDRLGIDLVGTTWLTWVKQQESLHLEQELERKV